MSTASRARDAFLELMGSRQTKTTARARLVGAHPGREKMRVEVCEKRNETNPTPFILLNKRPCAKPFLPEESEVRGEAVLVPGKFSPILTSAGRRESTPGRRRCTARPSSGDHHHIGRERLGGVADV